MYAHDRAWADSYESQAIAILRTLIAHLAVIEVASDEIDKKQATDFQIRLTGGTVAVRLRRSDPKWALRDMTIRSRRANGIKTELAKIKEGYAYRYLYGRVNDEGIISEWILVDLDKVRSTGLLDKPREEKSNKDGKTYFITITIKELEDVGCLIASHGNIKLSRQVNTQITSEDLEKGIERAKQTKCYIPRVM